MQISKFPLKGFCLSQVLCCCLKNLKPKGTVSWSEAANSCIKEWFGELYSKYFSFSNSQKIGDKFAVTISSKESNGMYLFDLRQIRLNLLFKNQIYPCAISIIVKNKIYS